MIKSKFFLVILLVLAVVFAFNCKKSSTDEDEGGNGDGTSGGSISITIGSGMTPGFSWAGGGVTSITVNEKGTTNIFWSVTTPMSDGISSPVTYGTTPSGAVQVSNTPLESGKTYTVTAVRTNADNGWKEFSR